MAYGWHMSPMTMHKLDRSAPGLVFRRRHLSRFHPSPPPFYFYFYFKSLAICVPLVAPLLFPLFLLGLSSGWLVGWFIACRRRRREKMDWIGLDRIGSDPTRVFLRVGEQCAISYILHILSDQRAKYARLPPQSLFFLPSS